MPNTIKKTLLLCAVLLVASPLVTSNGEALDQKVAITAYDYRQLRGKRDNGGASGREREPGHGGAGGGIGATDRTESYLVALVFRGKLPSVGPNEVQAITADSIGGGMSMVVLEHANTARSVTAKLTGLVVGTGDPRSVYISLGVTIERVSVISVDLGALVINGFVDPQNYSPQVCTCVGG
jgi:hypothetical protein